MNAVGIDVSKGKSMVAVMRPFGEVVISPFEVTHTEKELAALAKRLLRLSGETKVVMECTGSYYEPIANALRDAGLFVSAVHAKLIYNYDNDSIRRIKTDKADAVKIANYAIDKWLKLSPYVPLEEIRQQLRAFSRQYSKYAKIKTMLRNNLISLTDRTFPGVNELFSSQPRKKDGHEKWADFTLKFWHCECVSSLTVKAFSERYHKWCKKVGYRFGRKKAETIYYAAIACANVMPKNESTKILVNQAVLQLNTIEETMAIIFTEMRRLAQSLPEYQVVMTFYGVGELLGSQLIAEIGDVRRFANKGKLVSFAGLETPPWQSGKFESTEQTVSKKGSPHLRCTLFKIMDVVLKNAPANEPVFQFLDRKRAEKKHYYCYMTAGCAKFLKIYYARVMEFLAAQESE